MTNRKETIRALLARANHATTPQPEAQTALALASKLMQKYGFTDHDFSSEPSIQDNSVVIQEVRVLGKYRVQRQNLLYAIALKHSCTGYRSDDELNTCVVVLYGRETDIFAARTLFAAADTMGARLLPRGDRSWRISWWKGFCAGIEEALAVTRQEFISETAGAGLVLTDRMTRAHDEMRANGPRLVARYASVGRGTAYSSGQQVGRGFGSAERSFGSGVRGEIG
ncbi:MAG: DUF2786 domain-containing protein [Ilumatobacteraceae bacterium]|nr:DUF2786 domain-containing protein [Ilumatobacteraceae bacterium]